MHTYAYLRLIYRNPELPKWRHISNSFGLPPSIRALSSGSRALWLRCRILIEADEAKERKAVRTRAEPLRDELRAVCVCVCFG